MAAPTGDTIGHTIGHSEGVLVLYRSFGGFFRHILAAVRIRLIRLLPGFVIRAVIGGITAGTFGIDKKVLVTNVRFLNRNRAFLKKRSFHFLARGKTALMRGGAELGIVLHPRCFIGGVGFFLGLVQLLRFIA